MLKTAKKGFTHLGSKPIISCYDPKVKRLKINLEWKAGVPDSHKRRITCRGMLCISSELPIWVCSIFRLGLVK